MICCEKYFIFPLKLLCYPLENLSPIFLEYYYTPLSISILSFQDQKYNVITLITYVSGYWNKEYFYKSPYKSFFIILIHDISRKNCSLQFSIKWICPQPSEKPILIYIFTDFKTLLVCILVVLAHTLKGVNWTLNS